MRSPPIKRWWRGVVTRLTTGRRPPRGLSDQCRLLRESDWFDADWYLRQPGLQECQEALNDPVSHYLSHGAGAGFCPNPGFDGAWYLAHYPDVARAGLNPLVHYLRHGRAEGRLPRRNRALAWEHHLWRGAEAVMMPRLEALEADDTADDEERQHAAWALARWWAWQEKWPRVLACLLPEGQLIAHPAHIGPALLAVEALCSPSLAAGAGPGSVSDRAADLPRVLAELDRHFPARADTALAHANALDDDAERLAWINRIWRAQGLATVASRVSDRPLALDNLAPDSPSLSQCPRSNASLVSVIMPVYNAAETIATAVRSLFAQTWRSLELLVVDDASSDDTWRVLKSLEAECPDYVRLRLLRHADNGGAYAARNTGLMAATGALITTHDSDDWSHPEKLARQVASLEAAPTAMASLSHWVRATPGLCFHRWRVEEEGWVYRNISSLMVRRAAIETLGAWDEVSVNADSEYHERLIAAFGEAAVVDTLPGVPLAFGRADGGSLSQCGATHLITQFVGVRQAYMDAARRWHEAAKAPAELCLSPRPAWRAFAAPAAICRQALPIRSPHPLDALQASGLFDAGWYLRTHLDLQDVAIEPLAHYWQAGSAEGRDPGPQFSASGYRYAYPDVVEHGQEPLHHYLTRGRREGRAPWPILPGADVHRPGERSVRSVLLCGHQAGHALYGAERSLLDVLKAMRRLGWNVVVCLPSAVNGPYVEALRAHALAVAVLPYGWWQRGRAPEPATLRHFRDLIRRFGIEAVHANTLVLEEPLVAARQAHVPAVVHVRELPAHDPALRHTLNADTATLVRRVRERADLVIANSLATAAACEISQHAASTPPAPPVRVVPNTVEMSPLLALPIRTATPVAVGMLSSNLPKKGLEDLEAMARHLSRMAPDLRVVLFGPRTPALESLLTRQARGLAPRSLVYGGYVEAPAEALAELDIVVSLSRFQESFGRTALEAMAAARPVVGYAFGALPELIEDDVTGQLVPLGDTEGAACRVAALAHDPERRARLGTAGRRRARERFDESAMASALHQAYMALPTPARPGRDDNSRSVL